MSNSLYHRKPEPGPREPAPDKPSTGSKKKRKPPRPFHVLIAPMFLKGQAFTVYRCATREQAQDRLERRQRSWPNIKMWIEEKP